MIKSRLGKCIRCNYDLHGLSQGPCPECGTPFKLLPVCPGQIIITSRECWLVIIIASYLLAIPTLINSRLEHQLVYERAQRDATHERVRDLQKQTGALFSVGDEGIRQVFLPITRLLNRVSVDEDSSEARAMQNRNRLRVGVLAATAASILAGIFVSRKWPAYSAHACCASLSIITMCFGSYYLWLRHSWLL